MLFTELTVLTGYIMNEENNMHIPTEYKVGDIMENQNES